MTACRRTVLAALVAVGAMQLNPRAQASTAPSPAAVEQALGNVRRARNPSFVEYRAGDRGRVLVIGAGFSDSDRLTDDLLEDFESAYGVLQRQGWLAAFGEIELVVPQPLMRVSAGIDDIRAFHEQALTRTGFLEKWRIQKLGSTGGLL